MLRSRGVPIINIVGCAREHPPENTLWKPGSEFAKVLPSKRKINKHKPSSVKGGGLSD